MDKVPRHKHNAGEPGQGEGPTAMDNLPPEALDYIASHHFVRDIAKGGVRDEIFAVAASVASAAGLTWVGRVEYIWSFLGVIFLFYAVAQFF